MVLRDLLQNVDIAHTGADMDMEITGVSCNSSITRPGEVFVAVNGYASDGHDYVEDAIEKGASCVICQDDVDVSVPFIKVSDSRKTLALASAAWFGYPAKKMKLVGVTGTSGKTTVTHLIKHIIEKCEGSKVGLIGTIGNIIGDRELASTLTTPDSYELQHTLDKMAFEGCGYVVMEVSSHALYLNRVYGIDYDVGIFTNLSPEHLDFHPSMDAYASAKAMLFENCRNSIINLDDQYANRMIENSAGRVVTYAVNNTLADLKAKEIELYPNKTAFSIATAGEMKQVELQIPGMFSVYNALSAMAAGIILGFDVDDIAEAISTCEGVRGRAEVLPLSNGYKVLIDYAHKPDALENIIRTARTLTDGRVVTLFGCGGDRDKLKRPVMGSIAMKLSDFVFITSDNPRTEDAQAIIDDILSGIENVREHVENGKLTVIVNRQEAICKAIDSLLQGDVLIIAGKGHETYQILGKDKIYFDDREVVDEYLRGLREKKRKQQKQVEGLD